MGTGQWRLRKKSLILAFVLLVSLFTGSGWCKKFLFPRMGNRKLCQNKVQQCQKSNRINSPEEKSCMDALKKSPICGRQTQIIQQQARPQYRYASAVGVPKATTTPRSKKRCMLTRLIKSCPP